MSGAKKIVWALFDSGDGSVSRALKNFNNINIFSVGVDCEGKGKNFINCNLADFNFVKKSRRHTRC